ncbi:Hpt domain-containing protein [Tepidimonas sp.]|uniref:Hpt domain-containing protein n=1 Tax=Tepidimonas sp. TaxID=2002775 RepID=UPI002FE244FE
MDDAIDVAALAAATGDDLQLAYEILLLFDGGLDDLVARLHTAARHAHAPTLYAAAHELKGAAGSVGARALASLSEAIEAAARHGRVEAGAVAALDAAVAAFRIRLAEMTPR